MVPGTYKPTNLLLKYYYDFLYSNYYILFFKSFSSDQTGRKTMRSQKAESVMTIPILTVNPSELVKNKISKEKALRYRMTSVDLLFKPFLV